MTIAALITCGLSIVFLLSLPCNAILLRLISPCSRIRHCRERTIVCVTGLIKELDGDGSGRLAEAKTECEGHNVKERLSLLFLCMNFQIRITLKPSPVVTTGILMRIRCN